MTDYKEGDTLTLVQKDADGRELSRIVRTVGIRENEVYIILREGKISRIPFSMFLNLGWTVEHVEPAPDPLPNEPGWYEDKDGDGWQLVDTGDGDAWFCDAAPKTVEHARKYAPFTRLTREPETRADEREKTLREVLASLDRKGYPLAVDTIASQFGVEVPDE